MDEKETRDEAKPEGPDSSIEKSPPAEAVLELDHVYRALAHPRRRYLCYTLLEDTEWSLFELATKIAAWENDVPEHAVTGRQRTPVYVSLYHTHVPKLVDEGVITFDETAKVITAAENANQVLQALQGMGATLDAAQETHAQSEIDNQE